MRRSDNRSSRSRILALLTFVSTAIAIPIGCNDIAIQTGTEPNAPIYGFLPDGVSHPNIIPDQYIVVLKEGSRAAQREAVEEEASEIGANILRSYDSEDFQGFLAHIPRAAIEHVRRYEEVAWIEADRFGERTGLQTCPGWNLDMLDHQSKPWEDLTAATMLDDVYSYAATGAGATVLIVDTGIDKNEFPAGQAIDGNTLFPDTCAPSDPDGHGTMMAAVVAGKTTGVAKKAKVIGYNAANWSRCREFIVANDPSQGTRCMATCPVATCPMTRPIISDDVAALLDISQKVGTAALPAGVVVLLPHSFDALDAGHLALEQYVRTIVNKGGIFITSAGNSLANAHNVVTSDACDFTPARASDRYPESDRIITVGGLSPQGLVGAFNTGSCVDLFAPATGIRTRRPSGACGPARDTTDSGTSYAAAHVAGIAALMQENRVELNQFKYSLVGMATREMTLTDGLPGSPNLVLHSPYNTGESGKILGSMGPEFDADGEEDKIKLCDGGDLDCAMCLPLDAQNECNTSNPPETCTGRIRCTGEACARCGQVGDRCCAMGNDCDGGIQCVNGFCACGETGQKCCNVPDPEKCGVDLACAPDGKCKDCGAEGQECCPNGSNGPCDNDELGCMNGQCVKRCVATCCDGTKVALDIPNTMTGQADDARCIREGGDMCWNKNGPTEIRNQGRSVWDKNTQCPSLYDSHAVCCDGTHVSMKPQFDEGIAAQIAQQECNKGSDSTMRETYMGDQMVSEVIAGGCGLCDVLCCDGTKVGANYSWPGVSPENACKLFGGAACRDHGYGPQRIRYGDPWQAQDRVIWSKGTDVCPTNDGCIAICTDGRQVFVGDMFDEGMCDLFATTSIGCGSVENVVESHLARNCGGPDARCCEDGSCQGGMACESGVCKARCRVRCMSGAYLETNDEALTEAACLGWTELECNRRGFRDHQSVWFNGALLFNREEHYPGTCGGSHISCCHNLTDPARRCKNYPAERCYAPTPPHESPHIAMGYEMCDTSPCGDLNEKCCESANLPLWCGKSGDTWLKCDNVANTPGMGDRGTCRLPP